MPLVPRLLALAAALAALLALPAPAAADKQIVTCTAANCFSPAEITMDQGEPLTFRNADLRPVRHDVQSKAMAPDGRGPLFSAPLLDSGMEAGVDGSQFLTTGSYPFVCTVHSGMEGTLVVTSAGQAEPRPAGGGGGSSDTTAPELRVRMSGSKSAEKLARKRRIGAVVTSSEMADVAVVARIGSRVLGKVRATLFGGTPTDLSVKVSKRNAKLLRKGRRLTLSATATDAAGNEGAASAAAKLR